MHLKVFGRRLLIGLTSIGALLASVLIAPTAIGNAAASLQTPSPPSCDNQQTLVADGTTWTCTFDSEFTGTSYDPSQWQAIETATSGYTSGLTACFVNSPNNISVGNGYLSLTAREEAAPFTCSDPYGNFTTQYTSGELSTYGLFSQAYGRFEVNAEVPSSAIPGLQSSFWLYPQDSVYGPWPASGEIDIAEIYSEYSVLGIPYLHYNAGPTDPLTNTNVVTNYACLIQPGQFNDYVVEWTPGTITVSFNGTTCLIDHWTPASPQTGFEPFDQLFFINLTQALGVGTNAFDPATTQLPATTEIKYVRVWQQAN
jgi:beta-glucanase (GH16 family)